MPTPSRPAAIPRSRGAYDQPTHPLAPKSKVFILLVGIDDYPRPNQLYGCVEDVKALEKYIYQHFGISAEPGHFSAEADPFASSQSHLLVESDNFHSLFICTLINQQATYQNIIKGFRNFLRLAGPEDIAWFHFSGHGSEEFTAEAFKSYEPNGKDQTLVCYYEKGEGDRLHLADKELAVLLHEVATQNTQGKPSVGPPHLIVSLDCCHSGSGTREEKTEDIIKVRSYQLDPSTRLASQNLENQRDLASYLEGYFTKQTEISIPAAPHILLSACESHQKAGDSGAGGLFTTGLLKTLAATKGTVNYADLLSRTRFNVKKLGIEKGNPQNPQFETIGNFDPYVRFLDGSRMGHPLTYEVYCEDDVWFIKCGIIHGLPMQADQPSVFEIQTLAPDLTPLGIAKVNNPGAVKSELNLQAGLQLEKGKQYSAVIRKLMQPPVFVLLDGIAKDVEALKKVWDNSLNLKYLSDEDEDELAEYGITFLKNGYQIWDRTQQKLIQEKRNEAFTSLQLMEYLKKIIKWERMIPLDDPKSGLKEILKYQLKVSNKEAEMILSDQEIVLEASKDAFFSKKGTELLWAKFNPELVFKEVYTKLYIYQFHLRSNYSIAAYEDQVMVTPKDFKKDKLVVSLWKKPWIWGLSEEDHESTSYYKVIITTAELDHQQLLQPGIDDHRAGRLETFMPLGSFEEWCSFTIKVTLRREKMSK